MKRLRIYPAREFEWALVENDIVLQTGSGGAFPSCEECEVIVPADKVFLARARLPKANARRLAEIARYAVEESVISDPEKNRVVPGPKHPDGTTMLAVIDNDWMAKVLSRLKQSGIEPKRMPTELLLPKLQQGSWTLVLDESGGFLRTGEHEACSLDCGDPPLGLRLALQQEAKPARIIVHARQFPDLEHWHETLGVPFETAAPWDWRTADCKKGFDLLQGSGKRIEIDWKPLKPALLILAMMLFLQLSGIVFGWIHLAQEKKTLFAEMDRLFRKSFPEARMVVDAPLQMKRKLEALRRSSGGRQPGDFLALMESASGEIGALPPGSLESVDYARAGMDLEMSFPADEALDAFRKRLEARGLKVDLKKTEKKDGAIRAVLHVGAGGA